MHFYSHIQSARQIIEGYHGKEPFHRYIRAFFAQHKKFGSRDGKQISGLCYAYWRLGGALVGLSIEDKILAGHFVCAAPLVSAASGNISDPVLEQLKPAWNAALSLGVQEKFALITGRANAWEEESKRSFPGRTN